MVIRSSTARDVDQLLKELQGGDAVRREAAVARLRVLGSRAVARLERLLRDGGDDSRAAALLALEGIDDPRVVDLALHALTDPAVAVRLHAVQALRAWVAQEAGTRVMEALVTCALSPEQPAEVRRAAKDALAQLPPDIIAPVLDEAPRDTGDGLPAEPHAVAGWLSQHAQAPLSSLHALVLQLRAGERLASSDALRMSWIVARGAVHVALARRASAVALYDLRESFDGATSPLPLDFLTALTEIGDASSLETLARAWSVMPPSDVWWRERLADAGAAIMARLKLTRRHAAVKRVHLKWPGFLT